MNRSRDPIVLIDHFDFPALPREPLGRSLFRAVRRPIRRALIRVEVGNHQIELRALDGLEMTAIEAGHDRARFQIVEQRKATQLVINRLIEEYNELRRGTESPR